MKEWPRMKEERQTWPSENLSALHFAFYNANKKKKLYSKTIEAKKNIYTLMITILMMRYRNGRLVLSARFGI